VNPAQSSESHVASNIAVPDDHISGTDESNNLFDDDLLEDCFEEQSGHFEHDPPITGVVQTYLTSLKEKIAKEIHSGSLPACYKEGHFWIHPRDPFFAMQKAAKSPDGLTPNTLYYPPVFLWLPHLLDDKPLMCPNTTCKSGKHQLTVKGWNDNPIARRVVNINGLYYVMTQRVQCATRSGGCGKSWNLYDPVIMEQLDPGLAAAFPAFLTHRSEIDKTVMTLIRAGTAHRLSSSAWSDIL
jgi:hypothetical protein